MRKRFPLSEKDLYGLYWSKRLSTYEIAKLTGFSQSAIHYWMKKYRIKGRRSGESHCKRVNLNFSSTLAYILGVCYGDGSVHRVWSRHLGRYRYEVSLDVRNKKFAESFKKALEEHGFKVRLYLYNGWSYLFANSKTFYEYFHTLTINDLKYMLENDGSAKAFIRGFYESEGSYCLCYQKKWNTFEKILGIYNTNLGLLKLIRECFKKWGLEFHIYARPQIGTWRRVYALQTAREKQIDHFLRLIKPSIKYKPSSKRLGLR